MEEEESFSEVCDSIKVMISLLWAIRLVIQMYDGLQYIASLLVVLGYYYCTNPVSKIISPPDWYIASTSGKPLYKVIFNFFDKHCMPQYCAIIHVNEATNGAPGRLYYTDTERGHFLSLGHWRTGGEYHSSRIVFIV